VHGSIVVVELVFTAQALCALQEIGSQRVLARLDGGAAAWGLDVNEGRKRSAGHQKYI
jgi:hypothetical protein